MTRIPWWIWVWITFLTLGAVVILLGACASREVAPWPAQVCATYQAPDGTWMEEDNEPVDDDPCDTEMDYPKPVRTTAKPAAKPSVKASPAKPVSTPLGGRKKRF